MATLGNMKLTIVTTGADNNGVSHEVSNNLDAIIIQGRGAGVRMAFSTFASASPDYFYIGGNMPVSFAVADLSGKTLYFRGDADTAATSVEIMEILRGQA